MLQFRNGTNPEFPSRAFYIHWVKSCGDPADMMQGSLHLSEVLPETQHALKENIPHHPIGFCVLAEKYLKQACKVAQCSS